VIRQSNYIPLHAREQERVLTHHGNQAAATGTRNASSQALRLVTS
jgi:hypothetical protein